MFEQEPCLTEIVLVTLHVYIPIGRDCCVDDIRHLVKDVRNIHPNSIQKPLFGLVSAGFIKRVKENTTFAHREGRGHKMLHTLTRPAREQARELLIEKRSYYEKKFPFYYRVRDFSPSSLPNPSY